MKNYKIYRLINLLNGMSYVGYTYKKLIIRITEHCLYSNSYIGNALRDYEHCLYSNSYIGNALRDYELENFKVEILHEVRDKYLAQLLERMEIWGHKSLAPNGYNLTPGGDGGDVNSGKSWKNSKEFCENLRGNKRAKGYKQSKEHKEKRLKKLQGNKNAKGYKHSEDELEKMRGIKKPGTSAALKKNNLMKNSKNVLKCRKSRLQNETKKLEQELMVHYNELCPWDGT